MKQGEPQLILGVAFGLAMGVLVSAGWYHDHPVLSSTTWVLESYTDGELSIGVHPDGTAEIGRTYDRKTEAMKLLRTYRQMKAAGATPDCHETGYDDFSRRGWRPVPGGPMFPPPPAPEPPL